MPACLAGCLLMSKFFLKLRDRFQGIDSASLLSCAEIFEQPTGARSRVGIELLYRPARPHRRRIDSLESIPVTLKSLKIPTLNTWDVAQGLGQCGDRDAKTERNPHKISLVIYLNIRLQVVSSCKNKNILWCALQHLFFFGGGGGTSSDLIVQKPNSWTCNFVEVSRHNLESSQTWGFCMDFLTIGKGVWCSIRFSSFLLCKRCMSLKK